MKRILLILAILLLPPTTADAMKSRFSTAELCQILQPCQPPAQYARGPFVAKPVVLQVSLREVQSICGGGGDQAAAGFPYGIFGCAQITESSCIVHVPRELKAEIPELYAQVLAHELGHCRGWVHAHY
jgi:hypothetical protein